MLVAIVALLAQLTAPRVPVPIEIRSPLYPEVAVKARMVGEVEVEETVGQDGGVLSAVVIKSAVPPLAAAALDAAREWRFEAESSPGSRKYVIRFEFSVDAEAPVQAGCTVVGSTATFLPRIQTVRIRARYIPPKPTVNY